MNYNNWIGGMPDPGFLDTDSIHLDDLFIQSQALKNEAGTKSKVCSSKKKQIFTISRTTIPESRPVLILTPARALPSPQRTPTQLLCFRSSKRLPRAYKWECLFRRCPRPRRRNYQTRTTAITPVLPKQNALAQRKLRTTKSGASKF